VVRELLLKRFEPPAGAADPVRQGRPVELDALPGKDLALPVERQVIAVFRDQDMGEQGGRGQALGDRPLRGWGLVDGPAGPAAIARPADAYDAQPCRNVVEHLADRLTDQMQRAPTARAGLALKVKPDILTQQMRRQARPFHLRFGDFGVGQRKPSLGSRQFDFDILEAEMQLVVVQPLGPPAKLTALQLLDDEMQPFDLGLRLAEAGPLGCERAHQLLQRLHIIG